VHHLVSNQRTSKTKERRTINTMSDPDVRLQKLAARYCNSLEDQHYDPDLKVDAFLDGHQRYAVVEDK